ncbi:MAG: UDP-2,4-diacetamido-2,4,6-trideoxy-beta-L-altropyranose hydrolase [Bdellovibrionota bacterium]
MNFLFRADASTTIGSGHVMRCLRLANKLQNEGHQIFFFQRDLNGNLIEFTIDQGINTIKLERTSGNKSTSEKSFYANWLEVAQGVDASQCSEAIKKLPPIDWIVVDHYALDIEWETAVNPGKYKILVIDDLANRKHNCDLLVDQNFYLNMNTRYSTLVPPECKLLLGPQFAIMDTSFQEYHLSYPLRNDTNKKEIKNILVYFGGVDISNESLKVIDAISKSDVLKKFDFHFIIGLKNPHRKKILNLTKFIRNINTYDFIKNMAQFMEQIDICIGAGGTTTWERACLGIPMLLVSIAHNQEKICQDLAQDGYIDYLGQADKIDSTVWQKALEEFLTSPIKHSIMSEKLRNLTAGKGLSIITSQLLSFER